MRRHAVTETPLGWVAVLQTEKGIRRTTLPQPSAEAALAQLRQHEGDPGKHDPEPLVEVLARLRAFYAGEPVQFGDLLVDLDGRPPFARLVWEHVRAVPWGQVRTYGEVARLVGRPRATRAVGRAMATNPVPPIVPCHRVIGSGGRLTGFGGGLDMKARLLTAEGLSLKQP